VFYSDTHKPGSHVGATVIGTATTSTTTAAAFAESALCEHLADNRRLTAENATNGKNIPPVQELEKY